MSRDHKLALLIAVLFLLLLASCSSAITTGKANTPSPAPVLTATKKATEAPTEIPTFQPSPPVQLLRWDILLPDDIQTCKEVNRFSQMDPDNSGLLQEELMTLLEKEKTIIESAYVDGLLTINLNTIEFDFGDDPNESRRPNLLVINEWNPIFISCSYLPFDDSDGLFILGMRIRRSEDMQEAIIHLAMDDAGLKSMLTEGGLDASHYEIEKYYKDLSNQEVLGSLIAVVNSKGQSINDGPWKKSLVLLNLQPLETEQKLTTLITRYFNSERKLAVDEIHEIQSVLEKCLIPCFGLSLH